MPYWTLGDDERAGLPALLPRLRAVARPLLGLVRESAPGAASAVIGLQVVSGVLVGFGLLATTAVLDGLLTAGPTPARVAAALPGMLLVAAALALRGGIQTGVTLAQARLGPRVRRAAEGRLVTASLAADLSAFDDPEFYDALHRALKRGLMHVERATESVVEVVGASVSVVAAAGSLAVLHPALIPALALGVAPQGWAVLRAARLEYVGMNRMVVLARRVDMVADLAINREPAAEIRVCQAQGFVAAEHREAADALRDHEIRIGLAQARISAAGKALSGLGLVVTFCLLGVLINAGWVQLAVAGTAVVAIRTAGEALASAVLAANQLLEHTLYVADVEEFRACAAARTRPPTGRAAPAAPGDIRLREVSFRYPGGTPALRDIDLTIRSGQTVALVGENGSGKTTLAKLIAGLYRPTSGRITWDGEDIAEFAPASLADRVVMVLQEPVRWPHTAEVNVRLGRHDRADPQNAALHQAATRSGADEVVARLSQGWATLLSKHFRGGQELSGGQWQRFAVARGLYRDAPLLIWDEPTAPLDAKSEFAVYEALQRMAEGRTVILITHRLASVRHVDRIFLLHRGTLAEQGTHEELLAARGRYADLFDLQLQLHGTAQQ